MRLKSALARLIQRLAPALWLRYRIRFRRHQFEPEYWLIPLFCRKDRLSIDVGANMGEYAFMMRRHSQAVVAFEPNLELWPALRRLLGVSVRLEPAALSEQTGTGTLRYVAENSGVATIEARNALSMIAARDRIRSSEVAVRPLDSYAFQAVSFLKIDVEGHEESVLQGASQTIKDNRPVILVESENRHNPGAPERVAALMDRHRYQGFFLRGDRLCRLSSLTEKEKNFSSGAAYINNYIYIPEERVDSLVVDVQRGRTRTATDTRG